MTAGDMLIVCQQDGSKVTYTLPDIESEVSCLAFSNANHVLYIGYENGALLLWETEGHYAFQLHGTSVLQIRQVEQELWILYATGVLVRVLDVEHLLNPEELSYSSIRKYQLSGAVHSFVPLSTSQFIALGSGPMIKHFDDVTRFESAAIVDELDAMKIKAKQKASQMTSAVSSFARGWLSGSSRNSSQGDLTAVSDDPVLAFKIHKVLVEKRTIKISSEICIDDEPERTLNCGVASADGKLVLAVDQFHGRALLYQPEAGLFISQWKGYRNGQCFFIRDYTALILAPKQYFVEIRDVKEDRRLAKLDLAEALLGLDNFMLICGAVLVCTTPTALEIYRLSY